MTVVTVYVLVFWPGNPEDRPPELIAVANSLNRAKQAAADHARNSLHIEPPAEWIAEDDEILHGQLQPERPQDGYYAEERSFAIHSMDLLQ